MGTTTSQIICKAQTNKANSLFNDTIIKKVTDSFPNKISLNQPESSGIINNNSLMEKMGRPKYISAPMASLSYLPFRNIARRYGAQLCYSPMINVNQMATQKKFDFLELKSSDIDRPLIAQICGSHIQNMIKAVKRIQSECNVDAVDINLGCPQAIAKRGKYGAHLLYDKPATLRIVQELAEKCDIPITCKVRILKEDSNKTIAYYQQIQNAGCQLITIHGRDIDNKGHFIKQADWNIIRDAKKALKIPVFANGGIRNFRDVQACLEHTMADGVMSSEALLEYPALFHCNEQQQHQIIDMDQLALEIVQETERTQFEYHLAQNFLYRMLYSAKNEPALQNIQQQIQQCASFIDLYALLGKIQNIRHHTPIENKTGRWYMRYRDK